MTRNSRVLPRLIGASIICLTGTLSAHAAIVGGNGLHPAPATLGPYTMIDFPIDSQPVGPTSTVASPLGGNVTFGAPLYHHATVAAWSGGQWVWGGGYNDDVYGHGGATSANLTLPVGTKAFYFFVEPVEMDTITFTVQAKDQFNNLYAPEIRALASGSAPNPTDAGWFGFFGTGPSEVAGITILATPFYEFAIGEFAIANAIPEPSSIVLILVGVAAVTGWHALSPRRA